MMSYIKTLMLIQDAPLRFVIVGPTWSQQQRRQKLCRKQYDNGWYYKNYRWNTVVRRLFCVLKFTYSNRADMLVHTYRNIMQIILNLGMPCIAKCLNTKLNTIPKKKYQHIRICLKYLIRTQNQSWAGGK